MVRGKSEDLATQKALFRYQVISPVLDRELAHGEKTQILKVQASKTWRLPDGREMKYAYDTLRGWLAAYQRHGFAGLYDQEREKRGGQLPEEIVQKACELKQEVPERAISKIIKIMEELQFVAPGLVKRSTLHRALQEQGLSGRVIAEKSEEELSRFAKDHANDLWQSDQLKGPWLPDPKNPRRKRRASLYAFIDDCSRFLLYGRFFFIGDLPALELTFKRAMQRYGIPKKVYYDNALVYHADHMQVVCAEFRIEAQFTQPYRPEGHGKIEAFNHYCRNNFLAELKASNIATLDELNEAFLAWIDLEYNEREHSELGMSPKKCWEQDSARIKYVDERKLRDTFFWREKRTPDKCGIFSLFGKEYEVSSRLAGKRIEIRYNPDEPLDLIEVWQNGALFQRAQLRADQPYRLGPPQKSAKPQPKAQSPRPKTDYLKHLVQKRRAAQAEPLPPSNPEPALAHLDGLSAFIALFNEKVRQEVVDEVRLREFYTTYGPLDLERVQAELSGFLEGQTCDLHIDHYLNFLANIITTLRR